MRKANLALVLLILLLVTAVVLTTVGFISSQPFIYLLAGLSVLSAMLIFCVLTFRMYQRLESRSRQTNEVLKEIKSLQEQRYEQLARRLDESKPGQPKSKMHRRGIELEDLEARLQRAERRILGSLENNSLVADQQMRKIELLLNILQEAANLRGYR